MKIPWGARQILPLGLLAALLVLVSGFLELTSVVRLAADGARTEGALVARTLLHQVNHVVTHSAGDPMAALEKDPRIPLILNAAAEQAPSVLFVALCDSSGTAIAHTAPDRVGTRIPGLPPLPEARTLAEAARLLGHLARSSADYEIDTPLLRGGTGFGSIRVGIAGALVRDRVAHVYKRALRVAGAEIALALAIGFAMARVSRRRFARIGAGVAALRAGRFDEPIPESGPDEFSRLARDLNLLSRQFQESRESPLGSIQRAADLMGEGLLTLGPRGEIVLLNGPAADLLGLDAARTRGRPIAGLLPSAHPVNRMVASLLDGGDHVLSVEMPGRRGEPRYVAVGHKVMEAGMVGGAVVEFRAERELQEIHALVDHSRVLTRLGDMAAGVAHEIRNSLQAMHVQLAELRESAGAGPPELADQASASIRELHRLESTVGGFLKVARLRQIQIVPLDTAAFLAETASALEMEARLAGMELAVETPADLPATLADGAVLRQAIENLVRNAVEALPSRDGRVRLTARHADGQILVSVTDTGPGIPAAIRERVSELFFTTRETGTGVGLALARQAVEMHGGGLEIESDAERGTTVTLWFPVREAG